MPETQDTQIALINQRMNQMGSDVSEIKSMVKEVRDENARHYVTKEEFESFKRENELIKRIVYGFVSLVLVAVVGALLALVVRQ